MGLLGFATSRRDIFDENEGGSSTNYTAPYCNESIVTYDATATKTIEWRPVSEAWVSFYFKCDENFETQGTAIYIYDENDTGIFRLYKPHQETDRLDSEYFNGTSWVAFDTTWAQDVTTLARIDIHIVMDESGSIQVYRDETLQATFTGDTTNSGSRSGVKSLGIGDLSETNGVGGTAYYSAIIAADEDTLIMRYVQTTPGSNGTYTEWQGGYQFIDGVGFDSSTNIGTGTEGARFTVSPDTLTTDFDSQFEVVAVGIGARSYQGSTSSTLNGIELVANSSGTLSDLGSLSLTPTKRSLTQIITNDPSTGFQWSVPAAKSTEIGVRAIQENFVLLKGDEQTGTDQITLTGDMSDGSSKLKLEGDA